MALLDIIKQEISWGEISIPVANQKNKALEEKIKEQIKEIAFAKSQLESQTEHVQIMNNHLTNVQQQLIETLNLNQVKKHEIVSENDLQNFLKAQDSKIKQENKRLQRELDKIFEKKSLHENSVSQLEDKINKIREEIQWDERAMDSWLEEAVQRDDDINLLQIYASEDDVKMKDLERQSQKLNEFVQQKKKILDMKAINLKMAKMDLDKTTSEYKSTYEQHKKYILQWEATIEKIHERDDEIENTISELMKLKNNAGSKIERRTAQSGMLEERVTNNRRLEKEIRETERTLAKCKQQSTEIDKKNQAIKEEVDLLSITINDANVELNRIESDAQCLENSIKLQQERIARDSDQIEAMKASLSNTADTCTTSEVEVKRMESSLTEDRIRLDILYRELANGQKKLAADKERLKIVCEHEKTLSNEIQSLNAMKLRIDASREQVAQQIQSHHEILCSQDNEIVKLEDQIGHLEGHQTSMTEKCNLQEKMKNLKKKLNEKTELCKILVNETKQQKNEMRNVQKEIDILTAGNQKSESKLDEVNLRNEINHKNLNEIIAGKQKLMVEENLLKLELRRFQEVLTYKSANVQSMEKQRMEMKAIIKERQQEIDAEIEMAKLEIRMLEDSRQTMAAELNEIRKKTGNLKNRCETLLNPLKKWNGDEEITPIHYLLKLSEDRNDLIAANKAMASKVQSAERDVAIFQNTAQLLGAKNNCLRKALQSNKKTDVIGKFKEEKDKLDEDFTIALEKLDSMKRDNNIAKEIFLKQQNELDLILKTENETREEYTSAEQRTTAMNTEIHDQQEKIIRAEQTVARITRQLQRDGHEYEALKKDVTLRIVREQNRKAVAALVDITKKFPETALIVQTHFDKVHLPFPVTSIRSRTGSMVNYGNRTSSAGSTLPSIKSDRRSSDNSVCSGLRLVKSNASNASTSSLPSVVNLSFTPSPANGKQFKRK